MRQYLPDNALLKTRLYVVVVSILFSIWKIYTDDIVNSDGIVYLNSARLMTEGMWAEAYVGWRWPFYPFVIASTSNGLGINVEYSAYILNTFFWIITALAFVEIVRDFGANNKQIFLSGALILLLPNINDYRDYIIREPGYIAFFVLAFMCLIKYARNGNISFALFWGVFILLAALFRVEGFYYLAILPLVVFVSFKVPLKTKLTHYIKLNIIPLLLVFVLGFIYLVDADMLAPLSVFSDSTDSELARRLSLITGSHADTFMANIKVIASEVLNKYSNEYALIIILAIILIIVIAEVVKSVGIIFGGLSAYAVYKGTFRPPVELKMIWIWAICAQILLLLFFVSGSFFLSGRYLILLTLFLLMPVPFGFLHLYKKWKADEKNNTLLRFVMPVLLLSIFYISADSLTSFGASKMYIQDAGMWMRDNTNNGKSNYTNNMAVAYYSGDYRAFKSNDQGRWDNVLKVVGNIDASGYQYVAVSVGRKEVKKRDEVIRAAANHPSKIFENKRGDAIIIIYR